MGNEGRKRTAGPAAGPRTPGTGAALAALFLLAGCSDDPGPNLVLITIDTIRADRLGCYGYFRDTSPELDALARESLVFERCLAPISTTFPSHISLMTGSHPAELGAVANVANGGRAFGPESGARSIADVLRQAGYRTGAAVSATPLKRHCGIDTGFEDFHEPDGPVRSAGETNEAILPWLRARLEEAAPFFLWAHYYDPHSPYAPPAPFDSMWTAGPEMHRYLEERRFADVSDPRFPQVSTALLNDWYDGEVSYTDREIGRVLDLLRGSDAWDNTIVVVVGDHGEGIGQHDEEQHGTVWEEQLRVPLIMRVPGAGPARVPGLVAMRDVLPTLLGLADLPGRTEFLATASGRDRREDPGASVLGQESSDGRTLAGRTRPRLSLTARDWKLVHDPDGSDRLFELANDPFELENVQDRHPEKASELRDELLERIARLRRPDVDPGAGAAIDEETIEQMRSLGYTD